MLLSTLIVLQIVAVHTVFAGFKASSSPIVHVQYGTLVGSSDGTVDSFLGVPYAQPPVGNLRLRPPQPISKSYGTSTVVSAPTACPQQQSSVGRNVTGLPPQIIGFLDEVTAPYDEPQGEDCLNMVIQRPSNTTSTSKLPVLFWIFGGGFETGSNIASDATELITHSINISNPILYVAVNYRVNGFGFLAGKELQEEGSTNLGLRDQRLGLEWVADNIAAFGGDPDRVTIWGESSGSISVYDQLVINGGNNTYKGKPLFHGAIMDSGTSIPALPVTSHKAQSVFDSVALATGCSTAANIPDCLRSRPFANLSAAINQQPTFFSYSSLNLSYLPRPDPKDNFFSIPGGNITNPSQIAKVPIIVGDQQDEGTIFSLYQHNITTTAELVEYIQSYFPSTPPSLIEELVSLYPDDPAAGSPFNTGTFNNFYPQYKRLAAILGDITFTLVRRVVLSFLSESVDCWSYLSTYLYGTEYLGTYHASDVEVAYGPGVPGALAFTQIPSMEVQTYYISFVNHLNPNALATSEGLPEWPRWNNSTRLLSNFASMGLVGTLVDDFREAAYEFIAKNGAELRI